MVVSSLSCTGSEPNFSTVARSSASPWLKLPEISTSVSNDGVWNAGADCTTPSSTIATAFCGGVLLYEVAASWLNFALPAPLNARTTTHPLPPPPLNRALADVTSLPVSAVGPSW